MATLLAGWSYIKPALAIGMSQPGRSAGQSMGGQRIPRKLSRNWGNFKAS
jgi:hypothetical protein